MKSVLESAVARLERRTRFARVGVTIGGLEDVQRRALARSVGELLCNAGVREDAMTLIFHDARGPQVAVGRGNFPFWPET
jgi:hypothetical protein